VKHAFDHCVLLFVSTALVAAEYPAPTEHDVVFKNFKFTSGATLPELRIHYRTLGEPRRDARESCATRF
jgi:homoserine O-acetyltransferase